jgi:septum site-determining protein MinC
MVNERKQMQIKGIKDGLLITLGEGEWSILESALLKHVDEKAAFFQGARVALDVGNHILRAAEMGQLRDRLSNKGITLWAVISNSPVTESTSQMLGLATRLSTPRPERTIKSFDTNLPGESAVFVQRTMRSGFKVSHNGHVIVLGDVNPGAEIVAGGSVVVWGRLRGAVHAGVDGDDKAVVCALEMDPTQLRIAGQLMTQTPKKAVFGRQKAEPVMVSVQNGALMQEPWNPKR